MQKKSKWFLGAAILTCAVAMPQEGQAAYTGTLSVATEADFPPYEYCEEQEIIGIDMEMASLIADELGMELDICNMSFDTLFDALESGKTQIAIGRIVKPQEEKETILFSDGYMNAEYAVLTAKETQEYQREDLEGKQIAATDHLHGKELAEEFSQNPAILYEKEQDAVEALEEGTVDALILDEKAARYYAGQSENLTVCEQISDEQKFVIAVSAAEEELLTEINDALATMKETGELDKIVEKYLGEENGEETTE